MSRFVWIMQQSLSTTSLLPYPESLSLFLPNIISLRCYRSLKEKTKFLIMKVGKCKLEGGKKGNISCIKRVSSDSDATHDGKVVLKAIRIFLHTTLVTAINRIPCHNPLSLWYLMCLYPYLFSINVEAQILRYHGPGNRFLCVENYQLELGCVETSFIFKHDCSTTVFAVFRIFNSFLLRR